MFRCLYHKFIELTFFFFLWLKNNFTGWLHVNSLLHKYICVHIHIHTTTTYLIWFVEQTQAMTRTQCIDIILFTAFRKFIRLHILLANNGLSHYATMPITTETFLTYLTSNNNDKQQEIFHEKNERKKKKKRD